QRDLGTPRGGRRVAPIRSPCPGLAGVPVRKVDSFSLLIGKLGSAGGFIFQGEGRSPSGHPASPARTDSGQSPLTVPQPCSVLFICRRSPVARSAHIPTSSRAFQSSGAPPRKSR